MRNFDIGIISIACCVCVQPTEFENAAVPSHGAFLNKPLNAIKISINMKVSFLRGELFRKGYSRKLEFMHVHLHMNCETASA